MKVKIGNNVYDGDVQPIILILNDWDKKLISSMEKKGSIYMQYPESMPKEEAQKLMDKAKEL